MYDQTDDRGVPISAGIPPIVRISAIVGVIVIITIVGIVAANSGFGHAWPASTAVDLPLK